MRLRGELAALLDDVRAAALRIRAADAGYFDADPPNFHLVTALASGADQFAARLAVDAGWRLDVILPNALDLHDTGQCAVGQSEYRALLDAAARRLELPGEPMDPLAFAMAGRGIVAHCDILVALWDGQPARGRGGTADVVEMALVAGTPVIHVHTGGEAQRLIWSALDPVVISHRDNAEHRPLLDPALLEQVLGAILAPPRAATERQFLDRFFAERPVRRQWRIEYPLLMMLAGVRRVRKSDVVTAPRIKAQRSEWQAYRKDCATAHGVDAAIEDLEGGFAAADMLAGYYAQTYRSSHVFNFIFAALGTLIALSGLVLNVAPILLAGAEALVVAAIIFNTAMGTRGCWHQRWLDYRQLAERLRPMRSLKLLGIAAPDPPGEPEEPVARRWLDWYALCLWRQLGIPSGRLTPATVGPLIQAVKRNEFDGQIGYNRRNAETMSRFDGRLEGLAIALFLSALAVTFGTVVALLIVPEWVQRYSMGLTVLSAGLPVVGTAIFGIRVQGDLGALAARSRSTAAQLERIADELARATTLTRAADLIEHGTRVMLADLGEWRLVNELHELSLG